MADTAQIKITADTSQAERALGSLNNALRGLATVASLTALVKFNDSLVQMQNKLSMVTVAGQTSNDLFKVMARSSLELGASIGDVTDLYFRLAMNGKDLNLTQTETLRTTELLMKGFQLTGQSVAQAQGSIVQLGQAFSLGVLRGDELNSVLEGLPLVADALSAKFNVQRGALKVLGEQGLITSRDLYDAIIQSGSAIDKAWGNKLPTVTESFNRLQTVMGIAVNQFDNATGASAGLSLAIIKIASALVSVIQFFETWGKWIAMAAGALALLLVPIRLAVAGFSMMGSAIGFIIKPFTELLTIFNSGASMIGTFFAGGIFGTAVMGVYSLASAITGLFSTDKKEAASKYKDELDKLNKKLGLEGVEASNIRMEAEKRRSAQEISDQKKWKDANQARLESLRDIMRAQADSIVLSQYQGDELVIQNELQKANNALVKEVKNDKGEIIGYTRGLNALEEQHLRFLVQQNEAMKQQAALRAMTAPESTAATTSRAGNIFGNTAEGLKVEAERQKAALDVLNANKLISQQTYADQEILINQTKNDAMLASDQRIAEARMKLAGVTNQGIVDAVKAQMSNVQMIQAGGIAGAQGALGVMEQLTGTMANTSRSAFEMHKKLAIAQAMISTYQAAAMSIAAPPGPPFSYIYVATAIAAGMAQIGAIQSQQYSGRALGGPVMGNTPYIVGERGPELFTPASSGSITRNDNMGGAPVNVNFTIQANDAAGFDSLLNSRKGMIKQLITDAMLEKGQRF